MGEVAQTILEQLGGNRFRTMTGASSFASGPTELSFRIPKRPDGIKAVVVRLDADDTYTMKFFTQRPFPSCEVLVAKEVSGLYCDQLQDVFTETTGLATSLGRCGNG